MSVYADYATFLASKRRRVEPLGRTVDPGSVHPRLHDWQRELVLWAVRTGRAALWWDTGLGKSGAQIEWARLSIEPNPAGNALIVAPLAVCHQTVEEAAKLDVDATYVRSPDQVTGPGVWVTNYEMAMRFPAGLFDAVVLDEASILKAHDGKTRNALIKQFAGVPYRLACTATPAPNDVAELTSQAEFLGLMSRREMLSTYFVHDEDGWRLKRHARGPMFRWMATWAAALRSPADLGHPDGDYQLPPLHIRTHLIPTSAARWGDGLFELPGASALHGVTGRAAVRKATVQERCAHAVGLVAAEPGETWLLWAGRNDEAELLAREIPGAVNVHGAMSPEEKAELLVAFARGGIRVLVTKPSIAGFGMNWQVAARTAFVGLSDSYEQYYQAIRRLWRYGQTREVHAHIVLTDLEAPIAENIHRKETEADRLIAELVSAMSPIRKALAA
ncbi:MAG: helicase [Streptomycetaceae bacterium]|nr:helicase [Streptomycetaceae bacterium]